MTWIELSPNVHNHSRENVNQMPKFQTTSSTTSTSSTSTIGVLLRKLRWTNCQRENIFKFISTPVYWGEKNILNMFSLPFIGERK